MAKRSMKIRLLAIRLMYFDQFPQGRIGLLVNGNKDDVLLTIKSMGRHLNIPYQRQIPGNDIIPNEHHVIGCINHYIVVGLCSELFMRLSDYINLGF